MEQYYFILLVVVILKVLFWTFYCYVRAKRAQQPCTVRRVVIVGRHPEAQTRPHNHNDQSAIINHAEAMATSPPPYAEVTKGPIAVHPPTYDQAVGGYSHPAASGAMAPPTSGAVHSESVPGSGYSHQPHPSAPAAII